MGKSNGEPYWSFPRAQYPPGATASRPPSVFCISQMCHLQISLHSGWRHQHTLQWHVQCTIEDNSLPSLWIFSKADRLSLFLNSLFKTLIKSQAWWYMCLYCNSGGRGRGLVRIRAQPGHTLNSKTSKSPWYLVSTYCKTNSFERWLISFWEEKV